MTKLLSLYSSAAFATITESLLTKGKKKKIPNTKTFPSCKVVVRRHLASIYDPQGNGWVSPPCSSKQFYSNLKKEKGSKWGEIKTISASKVSKHGVSAASVYAINN